MRKSFSLLAFAVLIASFGSQSAWAQGLGEESGSTTTTPAAATPAATPAPTPAVAHARVGAPAATGAIKPTGLFLEVGLGGQLTVYNGLTSQNQQIGGSFLIGYKIYRLIFGLGLEYLHNASYQSVQAPGVENHDHAIINAMIFQPTIQFHLLESAPLALFLTGGLHVGFATYDETGTTTDDDTSTTLLGFHLGLGIRYFLHPRFCLAVEAGFRGLWVLVNYDPSGAGETNDTTASGAFYGRIGFGAIW